MPEKPANQDLSEGSVPFDNSALEATYERAMDTMMLYVGRNVTFYLEPIKTITTSNPEHYDPFAGGQDRRLGNATTGSKGYTLEPVWVVYKAHVKHGPQADPEAPFDLDVGDVQLTTVYGSLSDLEAAVEVDVDGIRFVKKTKDLRPIGWSTPKYIISVWTKKAQA